MAKTRPCFEDIVWVCLAWPRWVLCSPESTQLSPAWSQMAPFSGSQRKYKCQKIKAAGHVINIPSAGKQIKIRGQAEPGLESTSSSPILVTHTRLHAVPSHPPYISKYRKYARPLLVERHTDTLNCLCIIASYLLFISGNCTPPDPYPYSGNLFSCLVMGCSVFYAAADEASSPNSVQFPSPLA